MEKELVELDDRRFRKVPFVPKTKAKICEICRSRPVPKGPIRGCILTRMCEVCWSEGLTVYEDECALVYEV